jgi:hypothetical protein
MDDQWGLDARDGPSYEGVGQDMGLRLTVEPVDGPTNAPAVKYYPVLTLKPIHD